VYLDVWEQHVTYLQDPTIREPALNGPDTASRARLVTQVRVSRNLPGNDGPAPIPNPPPDRKKFDAPGDINNLWIQFVETLQPHNRGMLAAKAQPDKHNDPELCLASPNAGYGGMENQLYRVEIQRAGTAWDQSTKNRPQAATFKWSRENGAVVFSVYALTNNIATIEKPLDDRLGLHVGEWVEILGDLEELYSCPDAGDTPYHCHGVLAEVVAIQPDSDPTRLEVRLSSPDGVKIHALGLDSPLPNHPLLRRWDHRPLPADWPPDDQKQLLQDSEGALLVKEGVWLDLENGVKVLFKPAPDNSPFHQYRSGDYWLIPARTAVEDVLWPQDKDGGPKHLPPHGIEHHYAPLAFFPVMQGALLKDPVSLQRSFDHRAKLVS
jgi:hypothetical protein